MWDNTAIPFPKVEDAALNRQTWSAYYDGNVAKGGVFLQLCGWLGAHELWTGAVGDTPYFEDSGILEAQSAFAKKDLVDGKEIPVTNITDKGYRCAIAAWREGQFLLQPRFAKSDQVFTSEHVISSADIATDRGGNEEQFDSARHRT